MTRKRTDNELVVSAQGAAVPARRKSAVRSRAKHTLQAAEVTPDAQAQAVVSDPAHEQIAQLAYLYWESRGCQGGSPEEDWLRAEQELRLRAAVATA